MHIQRKPLQNTTIDLVTLLKGNLQSQDSLSLLMWKIQTGYSMKMLLAILISMNVLP